MLLNLVCNGFKLVFLIIFVVMFLKCKIGILLIVVLNVFFLMVFKIFVKECMVRLVDNLLLLMIYLLEGLILILCGDFGVGKK